MERACLNWAVRPNGPWIPGTRGWSLEYLFKSISNLKIHINIIICVTFFFSEKGFQIDADNWAVKTNRKPSLEHPSETPPERTNFQTITTVYGPLVVSGIRFKGQSSLRHKILKKTSLDRDKWLLLKFTFEGISEWLSKF